MKFSKKYPNTKITQYAKIRSIWSPCSRLKIAQTQCLKNRPQEIFSKECAFMHVWNFAFNASSLTQIHKFLCVHGFQRFICWVRIPAEFKVLRIYPFQSWCFLLTSHYIICIVIANMRGGIIICYTLFFCSVWFFSNVFWPGWPDWANFHLLGDCFLWVVFWKWRKWLKLTEATFSIVKTMYILNLMKMGWATLWASFSQTHLVTLFLA
jgi:hypothetical protein